MQHRGDTTGPTQVNEAPQRKIAPKPIFSSVLRPTTSWTVPRRPQTRNTRKKRKFFQTAKHDLDDLQNGIFEKPEKSENGEET